MAVAIVNTGTGSATEASSPLNFSFDATGCNFLVIAVWIENAANPDTVTYNSVSCTMQTSESFSSSGRTGGISLYTLASPDTGSNTVSVTWNLSRTIRVFVYGLSGVDTTDAIEGTSEQAQAVTNPVSLSVTQANDVPSFGVLITNAMSTNTPRSWAPDGSATESVDEDQNTLGVMGLFYNNFTGTGSKTVGATLSQTPSGSVGGFVLLNGTAAAGPTTVKTWDGVTQSTGIKTYFGATLATVKSVDGAT